jgi:hypothetical protein
MSYYTKMHEFKPITNAETYKRTACWSLSFFVQLGLGNEPKAKGRIYDATLFSLGSELNPIVSVLPNRNGQDAVQISLVQQEQQTLERALGVGTEAVKSALETGGLATHTIISVLAVEYEDLRTRRIVASYDTTQRAMEIETAIKQAGDLDSERFQA